MIASPIYSTAVGLLSIAINNLDMENSVAYDVEKEDDEAEDHGDINNQNRWYHKIFTYTKDFFEAPADSEF
jgi:hypothetical protein